MSVGCRAFIAALVTVLVTAVLVLIFTHEARIASGLASENVVRSVVLNYQTLITGVMAVGAAWATIWQMQKSEAMQDVAIAGTDMRQEAKRSLLSGD